MIIIIIMQYVSASPKVLILCNANLCYKIKIFQAQWAV